MDQNDLGPLGGKRFKAGMHRSLACRAAIGRQLMAQAARGLVDHRLHRKDFGVAAEWLHGAEYHRLPADRAILLGPSGAGAKPAPGCDKDGCGPF